MSPSSHQGDAGHWTRTQWTKMVVQVQVLGVASVEMAPSLMVATETQRLLFNVGDGTQRMCMEHHVRLAKLRHVFLTELRTHTLGGLPGMVLTVSDTGKDALHVHGPEGTAQYIRATRHFLFRPNFKLEPHDLVAGATDKKPIYADEEVIVHAVPMRARAGHKRKLNDAMQLTDGANDAVSYVVETPEQRGKFLVEKALALGVPKGALFGQLHKGNDVTLPDGRVVHSADCVSPSLPGSGIAIVACPAVSFIDELVTSTQFQRYRWSTDASTGEKTAPQLQLQAVYHIGGASVLANAQYVEWASSFGDDVDHILLDHESCSVKTVYRSSALLQAQLHAVFPHAFPGNDYELQDAETSFSRTVEMAFSKKPVVLGESMLKYTVAPLNRRGFDASQCFTRLKYDEIETSMAQFRQPNEQSEKDATITDDLDGRITFLGTGCAIPSKYRNVTGIYLQLPRSESTGQWNGMLLDCGEGSLGQLYRYTNGDLTKLRQLVQEIRCIWISHNHADHHLGIMRFLSFRSKQLDEETESEPILIIGPTPVMYWLKEYELIDPTIVGKYTFVENGSFNENDDKFQELVAVSKPARAWLRDTLNITHFETVSVKHAFKACAVVFTWKEKLKIVFSGDCRPSELLAEKAENAFLMIHEATFDDSMTAEAKQKDHSTTAEALSVGKKANAKHVILTHFSQRYPKMPAAVDNKEADENDSMSAMDLLSLRFSDLHTQAQLMETCLQILAMDDDAFLGTHSI